MTDYLKLLGAASVCLDPLYFGGAVTTCDALASGTPVVTLPTNFPKARFAAALCKEIGIEQECVGSTRNEYVEKAVRLATDVALRSEISERIRQAEGRVFSTTEAARHMERFVYSQFRDFLAD